MGIWYWLSGSTCETMEESWPLDGGRELHPCNDAFANATQPPCQLFLLREPASLPKKGLWRQTGLWNDQRAGNWTESSHCVELSWSFHIPISALIISNSTRCRSIKTNTIEYTLSNNLTDYRCSHNETQRELKGTKRNEDPFPPQKKNAQQLHRLQKLP